MKRIFLTFLVLSMTLLAPQVWAQCTIDGSIASSGEPILPVAGTTLPSGSLGTPYDASFTVIVPTVATLPIEAFIPYPFPGLPDSLTVPIVEMVSNAIIPFTGLFDTCDVPTCITPAGSTGCIALAGTPTSSGSDTVIINTIYTVVIDSVNEAALYFTIPQGNFQLPNGDEYPYPLTIGTATNMDESFNEISVSELAPNPANQLVHLRLFQRSAGEVTVSLFDAQGRRVHTRSKNLPAGDHQVEFSTADFAEGIYFYQVANRFGRASGRLMIVH